MTSSRGRALVTGATGLVGSYVVEKLRREGHAIRAMTRNPAAARELGPDVELVHGDVTDATAFASAARGCEFVFHTAAAITESGGWESYRHLNLGGTSNAIAAARAAGARLLHVSSVAVYGPGMRYQAGRLTDETVAFETLADAHYYARSKRDSEQLVMDAHAAGEVWATAVRPDVIYGRCDRQFVPRMARLLRLGFAPLINGGRSILPIIHAENVASAAWLAVTTDSAGGKAYNVTNERPVTVREFFTLAAEGLEQRVVGIPIPMPIARAMLLAATQIIGLVHGKGLRAMSGGGLDFVTRDNPFSSERATRELGWQPPMDPAIGIPDAFRWWQQQQTQKGRDHSRPHH